MPAEAELAAVVYNQAVFRKARAEILLEHHKGFGITYDYRFRILFRKRRNARAVVGLHMLND